MDWKDTLIAGASRVPTVIAGPEGALAGQVADWDKDYNRWISRNDWVLNPWGQKVISGSSEYWDAGNPAAQNVMTPDAGPGFNPTQPQPLMVPQLPPLSFTGPLDLYAQAAQALQQASPAAALGPQATQMRRYTPEEEQLLRLGIY